AVVLLGQRHFASSRIGAVTLVMMYASSTAYHASREPRPRRILRIIDHVAIYLLIAGTYTPFLLGNFPDAWAKKLFAIVWTAALIGVCFKIFYTGRYEIFSVALYLFTGWSALFALDPMRAAMSQRVF